MPQRIMLLAASYPITPFLSPPPQIYAHGLKSGFKPMGVNTDPFSAFEKKQNHSQVHHFL